LNEFDVVNTADERIFTFTNAAAKPEHANESIRSRDKEKEFAEFH